MEHLRPVLTVLMSVYSPNQKVDKNGRTMADLYRQFFRSLHRVYFTSFSQKPGVDFPRGVFRSKRNLQNRIKKVFSFITFPSSNFENRKKMARNPKLWGPHFWRFVHSLSLQYRSEEENLFKKILFLFGQILPCRICATDFVRLLKITGLNNRHFGESRRAYVQYVVRLHDYVNHKLGKPNIVYRFSADLSPRIQHTDLVRIYHLAPI